MFIPGIVCTHGMPAPPPPLHAPIASVAAKSAPPISNAFHFIFTPDHLTNGTKYRVAQLSNRRGQAASDVPFWNVLASRPPALFQHVRRPHGSAGLIVRSTAERSVQPVVEPTTSRLHVLSSPRRHLRPRYGERFRHAVLTARGSAMRRAFSPRRRAPDPSPLPS
jgi:hypothetical protein